MRPLSRYGVKVIAALLAYILSVQSAVAAVQSVQVQTGALPANAASAVAASLRFSQLAPGSLSLSALPLQPLSAASLSAVPSVNTSGPRVMPAAAAQTIPLAGVSAVPSGALNADAAAPLLPLSAAAVASESQVPLADAVRKLASGRIQPVAQAAAEAVRGVERASSDGSKIAAEHQFDALTGESRAQGAADVADPVSASKAPELGGALNSTLSAAREQRAQPQAEIPAAAAQAQGSFTQVFKDPERNKSFWRYVIGNALFNLGYGMYIVASPYMVENFTKNSLREGNDPRAGDEQATMSMVRQNRLTIRVVHYVAQGLSYVTVPLFSRNSDGNLKWLPRAFWLRTVALSGVLAVFFASGVFSGVTVLGVFGGFYVLSAFLAAQSYFQGISATLEGVGVNRILGSKNVSDDERRKANSILTLIGSVTDVVAPIFAGLLSKIGDLRGKVGAGSGIVYGIYAVCAGLAGLVYSTVRMFRKQSAGEAGAAPSSKPLAFRDVLKGLGSSLVQGTRLVLKNRFFAVMFGMGVIMDLFSDALGSSVLPEYVENIVAAQTGVGAFFRSPLVASVFGSLTSTPVVLASVGSIVLAALVGPLSRLLGKMGIKFQRPISAPKWVYALPALPILCWSIASLMSTAMGITGLLVFFGSLGSILSTLLIQPLCKALGKLGFKSEGSLAIPLGVVAALEVPLFWLMISVPSLWLIVPLYGLQALCASFVSIVLSGLNQKKQADYTEDQLQKMLSAQSLWGILATVGSLCVSKMWLSNVPISTMLLIAAIFTTVYGAAQLAFPWLGLSKAERQRAPKHADSVDLPKRLTAARISKL